MKYDIAALKRKMLVKYPFFGSVVASVDYKENKGITTAGTDGKTIYYNPDFLESLSVEQQTFVFAHEVCHIAFNHILRSEGKDHQIWNIATDAVINAFLKRDGLKMIDGGVDIAEAINYDAEQLYEKLLEEKKQQQQQQQSQGGSGENQNEQNQNGQSQNSQNQESQQQNGQSGGGSSGEEQPDQKEQTGGQSGGSSSEQSEQQEKGSSTGGTSGEQDEHEETKEDVGHDTHSMWEDAVKKHKEEQSKGKKKESLFDKLFNKDKTEKKEDKTEVEKKQEECEGLGEKDAFKKNLEEKKRELEELKEAIAKQATQAGTTTNRDIRTVTDIGRAKPLIDWRYVLREAIKYDVDWSYRNAYIEDGVVSANLEEQPMPETEIVLDTSGSINEVLLKNFLRECKNILQHSRVKVGCFDTEFYGFHEIRTEEDIENMRFQGGGGTDFDVAVGAFSRRVENKIIFTDGEASMPEKPMDAIWIVFGGTRINPRGGRVIDITEEQLERLYSFEMDNPSKGRSR